jgi:hypothetical protein
VGVAVGATVSAPASMTARAWVRVSLGGAWSAMPLGRPVSLCTTSSIIRHTRVFRRIPVTANGRRQQPVRAAICRSRNHRKAAGHSPRRIHRTRPGQPVRRRHRPTPGHVWHHLLPPASCVTGRATLELSENKPSCETNYTDRSRPMLLDPAENARIRIEPNRSHNVCRLHSTSCLDCPNPVQESACPKFQNPDRRIFPLICPVWQLRNV